MRQADRIALPQQQMARLAAAICAYRHLLTVDRPKFIEPLVSTINRACRFVSSSYRFT